MPRRPEDDEIEVEIEQREKQTGAQDEVPFDPWGEEEDASDRRRDPLRGPGGRVPDLG